MLTFTLNRNLRTKLAAVAAVAVCCGAATAPAAMALNPQPLPPRAVTGIQPLPPVGTINCREYGCM